jgi:hypothetical protein
LDQPGNEIKYLGAILDAFAQKEQADMRKDTTRERNRARVTEDAT